MIDKPNECQGCGNDWMPLYPFKLTMESDGWATMRREMWLCADCQHAICFEFNFLMNMDEHK